MRLAAVVNPVAGGGRAAREWPAAEAALSARFGSFPVMRTTGPDEASALAERLGREGAEIVVACGGDGTLSEVADGLLRVGDARGATPKLGPLPVGTGSDYARTLGLSADIAENAARIAREEWRAVDAGRVEFVGDDGGQRARYFINIASLGLSGPIDRAVNAGRRKGRVDGKLVFLVHTLRALVRYRFENVRLVIDERPPVDSRIALIAIANGRCFGGGMMVAPAAEIDDGAFDVAIFRPSGKFELIRNLNRVYSGAHVGLNSVAIMRARKVSVEPIGPPALLDVDGESPGRIPAIFEIRPRALTIPA